MSTIWTILWILAGLYTVGDLFYILTYDSVAGKGTVPRDALPQWILWTIGASVAFARHMNPLHLMWIWALSGLIVYRTHMWIVMRGVRETTCLTHEQRQTMTNEIRNRETPQTREAIRAAEERKRWGIDR